MGRAYRARAKGQRAYVYNIQVGKPECKRPLGKIGIDGSGHNCMLEGTGWECQPDVPNWLRTESS